MGSNRFPVWDRALEEERREEYHKRQDSNRSGSAGNMKWYVTRDDKGREKVIYEF